eukprot:comp21397_c0_seq1/m.29457 comp21397_c0_seq1/g.29457  ORF comp21397_c0_seq1/g.29457 comp21397_c0_seq1/m.29457 type:complete len:717 (-) comp21397_c0_seq1:172-2322(-)
MVDYSKWDNLVLSDEEENHDASSQDGIGDDEGEGEENTQGANDNRPCMCKTCRKQHDGSGQDLGSENQAAGAERRKVQGKRTQNNPPADFGIPPDLNSEQVGFMLNRLASEMGHPGGLSFSTEPPSDWPIWSGNIPSSQSSTKPSKSSTSNPFQFGGSGAPNLKTNHASTPAPTSATNVGNTGTTKQKAKAATKNKPSADQAKPPAQASASTVGSTNTSINTNTNVQNMKPGFNPSTFSFTSGNTTSPSPPAPSKTSTNKVPRFKPLYVTMDPRDDGIGLLPIFYSDPKHFVPQKNTSTGCFLDGWGITYQQGDRDPMLTARKAANKLYTNIPTPERQFVSVLMEKKRAKLEAQAPVTDQLKYCDFTIRITLLDTQVWREVCVSGGVILSVLHDKVLVPAMGWCRNYHSYVFLDGRDGAVFGPAECDAVDTERIDQYGWMAISDKECRLADILPSKDSRMLYIYDLNCGWQHEIVVLDIRPASASTGRVVALGGAGRCPPEDAMGVSGGKGNRAYAKAVREAKIDVLAAAAWNVDAERGFDANDFSMEETQKRICEALHSSASILTGTKRIHISRPTGPLGEGLERRVLEIPGVGFLTETVRKQGKDMKKLSLCWVCGTPHGLKTCNGCDRVHYCGRECQKKDWLNGHKNVCLPEGEGGGEAEKRKKEKKSGERGLSESGASDGVPSPRPRAKKGAGAKKKAGEGGANGVGGKSTL